MLLHAKCFQELPEEERCLSAIYLHWAENPGESECQRGSRVFHRHGRCPAPGQEDAGLRN